MFYFLCWALFTVVMTLLNFTAVLLGITLRILFELWKLGWRMSVLLARPVLHPARPPVPRKVELNPRRSNTLNHHLTTLMTAGPASAAHILTFLQWMRAVSAKKVGTRWGNSSREPPRENLKAHETEGCSPSCIGCHEVELPTVVMVGVHLVC